MTFNVFRAAIIAAFIAAPAHAEDRKNLDGTLIILSPTEEPGAVAEVEFRNRDVNTGRHNGEFALQIPGVSVSVTFTWNADGGSADRITVETGPDYYAWPERIAVDEGAIGTLYIFPRRSVGF